MSKNNKKDEVEKVLEYLEYLTEALNMLVSEIGNPERSRFYNLLSKMKHYIEMLEKTYRNLDRNELDELGRMVMAYDELEEDAPEVSEAQEVVFKACDLCGRKRRYVNNSVKGPEIYRYSILVGVDDYGKRKVKLLLDSYWEVEKMLILRGVSGGEELVVTRGNILKIEGKKITVGVPENVYRILEKNLKGLYKKKGSKLVFYGSYAKILLENTRELEELAEGKYVEVAELNLCERCRKKLIKGKVSLGSDLEEFLEKLVGKEHLKYKLGLPEAADSL